MRLTLPVRLLFIATFLCFCQLSHAVVGYTQFLRDNATEELSHLNCLADAATTPDNKFIYVTSFCDKAINIFSREEDGTLSFVDKLVNDADQTNITPKYSLLISPNGNNLYVFGNTKRNNRFRSAMFVYDIDAQTGALTETQLFDNFNMLGDDIHAVISADGNNIYFGTVGGLLYSLAVSGNGQVSRIQSICCSDFDPTFTTGMRIYDITISPDDSTVYISSREDRIFSFNRTQAGTLSLDASMSTATYATGIGAAAQSLTVAPDNQSLYSIFSLTSNTVIAQINADLSGFGYALDELPTNHPATRLYCVNNVLISDNQKLMYFVDFCADNFQVWGVNATTGGLTFYDQLAEGDGTVESHAFGQSNYARFSSDKHYVYNAGNNGLAVINITVDNELAVIAPEEVEVDTPLTLNISIENNGPATAHNSTVVIDVGALTLTNTQITGSNSRCDVAENTVTCEIFSLPSGAAELISLSATTPSEAQVITVTASAMQDQIDTEESNNVATANIDVVLPPEEPVIESPEAIDESEPEAPAAEPAATSSSGGGSVSLLMLLGLCFLAFARVKAANDKA